MVESKDGWGSAAVLGGSVAATSYHLVADSEDHEIFVWQIIEHGKGRHATEDLGKIYTQHLGCRKEQDICVFLIHEWKAEPRDSDFIQNGGRFNSVNFEKGDEVCACGVQKQGTPQAHVRCSEGKIVSLTATLGDDTGIRLPNQTTSDPLIISDVATASGQSGGPLFHTETGAVIGLIAGAELQEDRTENPVGQFFVPVQWIEHMERINCDDEYAKQTPPCERSTPSSRPAPNSCRFANDGECDEGRFCSPGTDTTDCRSSGSNSCRFANDGECDEGRFCSPGTDTTDCNAPDSCPFANDGECDEGRFCSPGTDTTDCSR